MPTSSTPRRQFESLTDAAECTGLSIRTIRRRIAAGQLRAYRSGPRVLRVDPADIDRLMVLSPPHNLAFGFAWPHADASAAGASHRPERA